jgi:hypothetical protein
MREIKQIRPNRLGFVEVAGVSVQVFNGSLTKPLYIRMGAKSITVSDRKPANYGNPTGKPNAPK